MGNFSKIGLTIALIISVGLNFLFWTAIASSGNLIDDVWFPMLHTHKYSDGQVQDCVFNYKPTDIYSPNAKIPLSTDGIRLYLRTDLTTQSTTVEAVQDNQTRAGIIVDPDHGNVSYSIVGKPYTGRLFMNYEKRECTFYPKDLSKPISGTIVIGVY